ncbi:DUF4381 domain-containing protein [Marinobacter zhanjiangensis]|uniref:DUF4381 domain-containing protein n=1 Tax=Marinobacter zhanjiangensis TaxID=578215 RepID=A0ABQ3AQV3_9GAMM|nr:DUF4381 domain-containing protein [Marinobacter zhanjiangensis]GGY63941.1 hypothetical protein GCM10007071_08200 [Marinobacter zhanjiangensis]
MIPDDVLEQLRDIQAPPPAGFWPPAPGWWILAALILVTLTVAVVLGWRRHRRQAPKRAALARLARYTVPSQPGPDWYAGLNRLLKEAALARYPGDRPAALSGEQWGRFLARTSGDPGRPWQQLVDASYRPRSELPPTEAWQLAEHWIRRQPW